MEPDPWTIIEGFEQGMPDVLMVNLSHPLPWIATAVAVVAIYIIGWWGGNRDGRRRSRRVPGKRKSDAMAARRRRL